MMASNVKILIVDDDVPTLDLAMDILRDYYEVYITDKGDDALSILERIPISLLLVDQRMPRTSGLELLKRVYHLHPDIVAILMSALLETELLQEAGKVGSVHGFLQKPLDEQELLATVRDALCEA